MINSDITELSSDFEITPNETEKFEKQELITWACKLELESIDYRNTSMQLIEQLSKLSKTLTDNLKNASLYLFQLKNEMGQRDVKIKNFIEVSIAEELDTAYNNLAGISSKIKNVQQSIYKLEHHKIEEIISNIERSKYQQRSKDKQQDEKIRELEIQVKLLLQRQEYINLLKTPESSPSGTSLPKREFSHESFQQNEENKGKLAEVSSVRLPLSQRGISSQPSLQLSSRKEKHAPLRRNKKAPSRSTKLPKQARGKTFTRKLL